MKIFKGLLATAFLLLVGYIAFFKTFLFWCIALGLFTYAGFSYWIFRYLYGKYLWVFKALLFCTILFIFIGGFYFQLPFAAMFTGKLLAWLLALSPFIFLFFAYQEGKALSNLRK